MNLSIGWERQAWDEVRARKRRKMLMMMGEFGSSSKVQERSRKEEDILCFMDRVRMMKAGFVKSSSPALRVCDTC